MTCKNKKYLLLVTLIPLLLSSGSSLVPTWLGQTHSFAFLSPSLLRFETDLHYKAFKEQIAFYGFLTICTYRLQIVADVTGEQRINQCNALTSQRLKNLNFNKIVVSDREPWHENNAIVSEWINC